MTQPVGPGMWPAAMLISACLVGAQPPAPAPEQLTVEAGERLVLELETPIHTRVTREGEAIYFRTAADVRVDQRVVIPRGSTVKGTVTKSKRPGRLKGRAELQLRLDEVRLADGSTEPLVASIVKAGLTPLGKGDDGDPKIKGESGSGGNAGSVLSGATQGAIGGVIFGGGKGAMYGGAVGAGIGLAGILFKRGPDLDLPRGTIFEARFDRSLEVSAKAAGRAAELARAAESPTGEVQIAADEPPDFRNPDRPRLGRRGSSRVEPPVETVRIEPPVETVKIDREEPAPATPPPPPTPTAANEATPDPTSYKLSVSVRLVQVDAVVRDRLGRPMENLRRDDFRLFEEGIEQDLQSFSRDEYPLAVALVIDRSGSVAPFMNEIRHAAYRALVKLKPGDQVCLFSFASQVERLEDLTTDRQKIADRIATIRAGGGTNIIDALHDSVMYLGMVAPERRRAVILISDNKATTRPRAGEDETIRLAQETETVIYSVKTAGESIPFTMRIPNMIGGAGSVRKVTEETGGEIIDVGGAGSLDSAFETVILRLKLRYTLGYYPPNSAPGSFRRIEVRLAERYGRPGIDYSVHSRNGYYTPAEKSTSTR